MNFEALLKPASQMRELSATEAFADLRAHVARLDLPDGETVDWSYVQRTTAVMLTGEGKDLLLATYAAFAPLALGTSTSPSASILFLQQFMQDFWHTMSPAPTRCRARANIIAWFVTRLRASLPAVLPMLTDAQRVETQRAWGLFSATVAERLGALAPSTTAVERLLEHASQSTRPLTSDAPNPTMPPASAAFLPAPSAPGAQAHSQDCRALARSVCLLAKQMREAQATHVQACRLWRVGLWLNVHEAPELLGDVTRIVPIAASVRAQLTQAQRSGQWSTLYTTAEDAMLAHPLCLDLQYYAAEALTHMGNAYAPSAQLVLSETQALCRRVPELASLRAADGTALAMGETQAWLQLQAQPASAPAPSPGIESGSSSRTRRRFLQRLKRAQTCLAQGQTDAAEALYDALVRGVQRYSLATWEPRLARLVARGHLDALSRQLPPELSRIRRAYRLWAALNPDAAQVHAGQMTNLQGLS